MIYALRNWNFDIKNNNKEDRPIKNLCVSLTQSWKVLWLYYLKLCYYDTMLALILIKLRIFSCMSAVNDYCWLPITQKSSWRLYYFICLDLQAKTKYNLFSFSISTFITTNHMQVVSDILEILIGLIFPSVPRTFSFPNISLKVVSELKHSFKNPCCCSLSCTVWGLSLSLQAVIICRTLKTFLTHKIIQFRNSLRIKQKLPNLHRQVTYTKCALVEILLNRIFENCLKWIADRGEEFLESLAVKFLTDSESVILLKNCNTKPTSTICFFNEISEFLDEPIGLNVTK